jgi:hypothetical protein
VVYRLLKTHFTFFSYESSSPSFHWRYITEASTFAGDMVFGSFRRDITERRMVRTLCEGFQRSFRCSPLWGSSTGGCRIEMQRSPF